MSKSIAIIGAGPIGLEAALLGLRLGYDVTVLESGRIASNVQAWGHVRMFSPFGINSSHRGRQAIGNCPPPEAILTGGEFCQAYLKPLAELPEMTQCIREQNAVVGIGRCTELKADSIGKPSRMEFPFRLLVHNLSTRGEWTLESDFVLDCSGVFTHHNWLGAGGVPAVGERTTGIVDYGLPSDKTLKEKYANKRVLLIGSGYSAATNAVALARLKEHFPKTEITWLTRRESATPLVGIPDDALPERAKLVAAANQTVARRIDGDLAAAIHWKNGFVIDALQQGRDGVYVQARRAYSSLKTAETLVVDRIIANVGYRPDSSLYQELQVHQCYATEGPIKLAASLMGQQSGDCMTQESPGPQTLLNPEPGFLILGAKSYGRDSRFLLRIGLEQVEAAYSLIKSEWS